MFLLQGEDIQGGVGPDSVSIVAHEGGPKEMDLIRRQHHNVQGT